MYTRRMYRKTPPGYSGVLFSEDVATSSTLEEDRALSPEQQKLHEIGREGIFSGAQEVVGHTLSPTDAREDLLSCAGAHEQEESGKTDDGREGHDLQDELTLIGALLVLLGTGLCEESALVLLTVLVLLT